MPSSSDEKLGAAIDIEQYSEHSVDEGSVNEGNLNDYGAPIEKENPLGSHVNYMSLVYIVVQGIVGTGIFSTPGTILNQIGSIGAAYVLWVAGFIISLMKVMVYMEYVTYFSNRSGGDVVYLEQAYPKPQFLVPTTYAAITVVFSFATSSASAFGSYILKAAGVEATTWRQRGIGVGVLFFCAGLSAISTKWSLRLSNFLGHIKIITLAFIIITGFVVLGGNVSSVPDPLANFQNSWDGTTTDPNDIANAIIKISFTYSGVGYAFGVASEMPKANRITGYTRFVPGTFFVIFLVYLLCVTAYYSGAGTIEEIKESSVLTASLFFYNIFGTKGQKGLNVLVALSALGHLLAVILAHSRSLREVGRQGVLPWKKLWVSTKPFGTPLGPLAVTLVINLIVLLAPPAGDAYNFVTDLGLYAAYIFDFLLSLGLFFVRRQRKQRNMPPTGFFRIPTPILCIQIMFQLFIMIMPLVPPENEDGSLNGSDVSFFYATYCIVAFGIVFVCVGYYSIWQFVLPKYGNYRHRVERYTLENGELGNRVIRVPVEELEEFDEKNGKQNNMATMQMS